MRIPARYNGPPSSANGGYSAGYFASTMDAEAVMVTLLRPPPLDTPLAVERIDERVNVRVDDVIIAQVAPVTPPEAPVPPVSLAQAQAASRAYPGFVEHPFPSCFVCGPARAPGDGLRIFAGPLPDGRTAAPWRVPPDVDAVMMWAALDCPGGWAIIGPGRPYVLGRMAARVLRVAAPGTDCIVMGQVIGMAGRKAYVRSTIYAPDGAMLALAEATWVALPDPTSTPASSRESRHDPPRNPPATPPGVPAAPKPMQTANTNRGDQ